MLMLIYLIMSTGCKKVTTVNIPVTADSVSMQINKFIYYGLSGYYLWVDQTTKLSTAYYDNSYDTLVKFLGTYTDHEKLFYDLLYQYGTIDKWSWIVNDYVALENYFQGITKSLGYDYRLYRVNSTSDSVFGVVRYVVKGSPADNAGIKRGDIFSKINNQQITTANYGNLLVDSVGYKLSFAKIVDKAIVPNGIEANLSAIVVYEDPIYYDTVYTVNGYKVGYLVYNGFMSDYDIQLNQIFSSFKGAGVNKLILDLRYNGGGSIQSAIYLASMIYGTTVSKEFIQTKYNAALEAYLLQNKGANYFNYYFTDVIAQTTSTAQTTISTLNLSDLYVITTRSTASASELIINGLNPYMPVITFGDTTVGKYVGSMTVYDYYNYDGLNPNHTWALQPIVLKIANSAGVSDYVNGFAPTVKVKEDVTNLQPFGSANEPMLNAALNYIKGLTPLSGVLKSNSSITSFQKVADSKDRNPHSKEMYFNDNLLKDKVIRKSSRSLFQVDSK